ncbi:hypothetical protein SAY86_029339 [Trapa natans]|uniref:Uncharacterized protein n=1 Tax=Trapa natans TaxID=22666 RepID=A0AAN7RH90_TRANT|nr:hypothetical protein SAY86_029339 [Trapa natans]
MAPQPPDPMASTPPPAPLHSDDADEDDENVKQLRECSSLYLSLQECLVNSDRNWKSCQKGMVLSNFDGQINICCFRRISVDRKLKDVYLAFIEYCYMFFLVA